MTDKGCQTSLIDDVYDNTIVMHDTGFRTLFFKISKTAIVHTNAYASKIKVKKLCRHHLDNIIVLTNADLFERTSGYINPNIKNCFDGIECSYIHLKPNTKLNLISII